MGSVLDHLRPPARRGFRVGSHLPFYSGGAFPINAIRTPAVYPESLVQLVRNIGITNGDETRVGYYIGLMVRSCPCLCAQVTRTLVANLIPLGINLLYDRSLDRPVLVLDIRPVRT